MEISRFDRDVHCMRVNYRAWKWKVVKDVTFYKTTKLCIESMHARLLFELGSPVGTALAL